MWFLVRGSIFSWLRTTRRSSPVSDNKCCRQKLLYLIYDDLFLCVSFVHHSFIIRSSFVHHSFIIRSSFVHHSFIIRLSFVHHSFIMRSSIVRCDLLALYLSPGDQRGCQWTVESKSHLHTPLSLYSIWHLSIIIELYHVSCMISKLLLYINYYY